MSDHVLRRDGPLYDSSLSCALATLNDGTALTLNLCYPTIPNVRRRGGTVDMLCSILRYSRYSFGGDQLIDGMRFVLYAFLVTCERVHPPIAASQEVGVQLPTFSSTVCMSPPTSVAAVIGVYVFQSGEDPRFPPPPPLFPLSPVPSCLIFCWVGSLWFVGEMEGVTVCCTALLSYWRLQYHSSKQLNSNNLW